ncbi:MAG TPA: hypothetical protein DCZ94_14330 [Lentisphaeria bacterium]|nr:MAG: hypothetical protein A2X48_01705 [Lentisphaerae bacterium GWF2_49_21]HBC88124.1 hypothetical protein [Lentisphaeria bacterium]
MLVFYILFEFAVIGVLLALIIRSVKKIDKTAILVMFFSLATVATGELINNFTSKVTVYNPAYILWIPRTDIPVFIICGGVLTSFLLYKGCLAGRKIYLRFILLLVFSSLFPLMELAGIGTGLWKWPGNPDINLGWIIGVWKFYFIFIGIPALAGIVIEELTRKKKSH